MKELAGRDSVVLTGKEGISTLVRQLLLQELCIGGTILQNITKA